MAGFPRHFILFFLILLFYLLSFIFGKDGQYYARLFGGYFRAGVIVGRVVVIGNAGTLI